MCKQAQRGRHDRSPLQIATALRGASPDPALHWAGTARITRKPASGLATKHTEMKGSVPSHLRCDVRCAMHFLLPSAASVPQQVSIYGRHPSIIGQMRAAHVLMPPATRHGERAASHQPLTAPRTLKEPAIGCGCEISASSWPCNTLQRARRRSAFPKTSVPSSTAWDAHEPSAIFRQFLVAHLLRQQNQAAGKLPRSTQHTPDAISMHWVRLPSASKLSLPRAAAVSWERGGAVCSCME
jgi:hypothetical protein